MAAGIKVRNRHGTIQIGQDYANFARDGGRKNFSVMEPPYGGMVVQNSTPPAGTKADSLIVSANTLDDPYFGWNWGYCWVFKPADQVSVSGVAGKRVRNPRTGKLVFDSSHNYLRVVDFLHVTQTMSKTYPADRVYRLAPLAWSGWNIIRYAGNEGGLTFYRQLFSWVRYEIAGTTIKFTRYDRVTSGDVFDGPEVGFAGEVGSDPSLTVLVVDVTGYPGVT